MKRIVYFFIAILSTLTATFAGSNNVQLNRESVFIENKGQWDSYIKFASNLKNLNIFVTTDGIVYDYYSQTKLSDKNIHLIGQTVKMEFQGANNLVNNVGLQVAEGYRNYFIGNNPDKWVTGAREFQSVKINNVYNGIDLVMSYDDSKPRYDFVVQPNANPENITINFRGTQNVSLSNNRIELGTIFGHIIHGNILAYQEKDGYRLQVPCNFILKDDIVSFKLGDYDKNKPIVIDPTIMFSFFGGFDEDEITGMAYIGNGSTAICGWTKSSNFRTTPGAYDTTFNFQEDSFVAKYTFYGLNQVMNFITLIGGSASDICKAVAVDANSDIYIVGTTSSTDFPKMGPFQQKLIGGLDVFITKLKNDGKSLVYSSYYGGSKDDFVTGLAVGTDFSAYFCGYTSSKDLPTAGAVYQKSNKGLDDIFVAKVLASGSALKFSTYLGGTGYDRAFGMCLDNANSVYLTGETNSGDFPTAPLVYDGFHHTYTKQPYSFQIAGSFDAFFVALGGEGSTLDNSTFFGGKSDDRGVSIAVDNTNGSMYIAGVTSKEAGTAKFPITANAAFKTIQGSVNCFFAQMDKPKSTGGVTNQALLNSTFLGGNGIDSVGTMAWDENSNVFYLVGTTTSTKFPIVPAGQTTFSGKNDGFISKLSITGSDLLYSTYVGGKDYDYVNSIVVDERGDITYGGYTQSKEMKPILDSIQPGGYGGGTSDGFIGKMVFGILTLSQPAGGENYCSGGPLQIKWNEQGFSDTASYTIEYSRKSVKTWNVVTNKANSGEFDWQIPKSLPQGDDYQIRISHTSGIYSLDDSAFSIHNSPTIQSFSSTPANPSVCEGDPIRFTVAAAGSGLVYFWYFNGTQITGANQPTLDLDTKIFNKSGAVHCIIGGTCSPSVTSNDINISIKPLTKIVSQSNDVIVRKGKDLNLKVSASGLNLTFSWMKDGLKLTGYNDSTLSISNVGLSAGGVYNCTVTGDCGTLSTKNITVTIDTSTAVYESINGNSTQLSVNVYQTDNQNTIIATIYSVVPCNVDCKLIDIKGNPILKLPEQYVNEGNNQISFDVSKLSSGTYWMVVECGNERTVKKFQLIK